MRTFVLAVVLLSISIPGVSHSAVWIGVYADTDSNYPEAIVAVTPPTVGEMHVLLFAPEPVTSVRFKIERNPDFGNHALPLGENYLGHTHVGSLYQGVTIGLNECRSGLIHVMTFAFRPIDDIECGLLDVVADPAAPSGSIEVGLCADGTSFIAGNRGYVRTQPPYFSFRQPPDGVTGVPLHQFLGWAESYCYEGPGDCFDSMCSVVYIGTDPENMSEHIVPIWSNTFDLSPLLPNTTYYWKLNTWYVGESTTWSFTTGDAPVPIEARTWGQIKGLYR